MRDPMVTWLRGVLDETARVASEATPAPWVDEDGKWPHLRERHVYGRGLTSDYLTQVCSVEYGATPRPDTRHIALNDPRSVLARVEAERAILDEHLSDGHGGCDCCLDLPQSYYRPGHLPWPCPTLRWLAYGHRHDMEGYDPAWAPVGVTVDG